jgi:hypothetical protein
MTAKGKITTVNLIPGQTRVMVRDNGDGTAEPSATRVKGATPALVVKMNRRPAGTVREVPSYGGGTRRKVERRSFFELGFLTDDDRRLVNDYSTPSQTYWLA